MTCLNKNVHAYDHWFCQRRRFHLGRHRYNNYTWSWFPFRFKMPFSRPLPKFDPVDAVAQVRPS